MNRPTDLIIDAHGHIMEPTNLWKDYVDPKFRDRALEFAVSAEGIDHMVLDGQPSPYSYGVASFVGGTGIEYEKLAEPGGIHYEDGPSPAFNPVDRLNYLDKEGIDLSLIYPSTGLIWGSELKDIKLNDAYTRAYNDWAFDFCAEDPQRLFAIAFVPVLDINIAIAEVRRTAKLGAKGFVLFATPLTTFGFWSKEYDPLWAEIEATGLPLIFHPALNEEFFGHQFASEADGITDDRYLLYLESCSVVLDLQAALAQLFQGGVFDRFPKLNIVMLEIGAGWVWHYIERADVKYQRVGSASPLKHLPSEYFRRQIVVGIEPHETMIPELVSVYGAQSFIWGTDYPHWDCVPDTLPIVIEKLDRLNAADRAAILGGNAKQLFKL